MNGTLHIEVPVKDRDEFITTMQESQALASSSYNNGCFVFNGGLRIDMVGGTAQARFQNEEQMRTLTALMERWCGMC